MGLIIVVLIIWLVLHYTLKYFKESVEPLESSSNIIDWKMTEEYGGIGFKYISGKYTFLKFPSQTYKNKYHFFVLKNDSITKVNESITDEECNNIVKKYLS